MDEAQQLCDRVAIVDQGKVIALGTPGELIRSLGAEHLIEIEAEMLASRLAPDDLRALPGVQACEFTEPSALLTVTSVHTALPAVLQLLAERGVALRGHATRQATLEDVFVHLTGRHLREDSAAGGSASFVPSRSSRSASSGAIRKRSSGRTASRS
jgi:ABC-2 type transport system ATP-binding protein